MNHHTSSLVDSGRDTLITYQSISSTHCSHAEPLNRHGIDSLEGPVKIRSPAAATGTLTTQDEPDKHTDSYKKDGPSAIDKAVHLFFFTEILRGRPWSKRAPTMSLTFIGMWIIMENFFRPPYIIMYPYEKGPLSPPPSVVNMPEIPKRRRALHRYVPSNAQRARLTFHPACKLCEAICPAQAITIESEARQDGSRRTTKYGQIASDSHCLQTSHYYN